MLSHVIITLPTEAVEQLLLVIDSVSLNVDFTDVVQ